ncbi:uncharacterized protein EV154DRAFT_555722 [Mucor mucedo]|uniref:uncharacterized protein n=1 Tax=Mucor mucedo TaxID=29922 RepID=UPI00221F6D15|nr:uncharacterized protein EV154DRAFT_555722 [Mucor mucedo]KAI7876495.1 hypothetical protein EV154DRAFT_555722 [Mucor mucedo]
MRMTISLIHSQRVKNKSTCSINLFWFEKVSSSNVALWQNLGNINLIAALLETFNNESGSHIEISLSTEKAAYGLLSMLHAIAYQFNYADITLFKKMKVLFVHAAKKKDFGLSILQLPKCIV